jgi:hypothetical protein
VDLLLCWLVGPAALVAVALGLSFGLELTSGVRLPWTVRPAAGLAVMIVLAQLLVSTDTTAELAIPAVVGLGAFGLVMGWSARIYQGPLPGWELAAAGGVYLVFGAPVLLSGDPTFAGFIKLDDTATWMALTDHAFEFGRKINGFEPSTWEALIDVNAGNGYPIGSFVPMALMSKLTGQDLAWTIQPSMALMAAMLSLLLAQIVRPLISPAPVRAAIAFLAAQSAMLLGYTFWGGVKEVAAALLLALGPLLCWYAIEQAEVRRRWILPGLSISAFLAVLGAPGAVWLVPTLVPMLLLARDKLGTRTTVRIGGASLGFALVLSLPQLITPNGFFNPFQKFLFEETELGNLAEPLSIQRVMGVWPAEDFRLDPDFSFGVTILAVVLAGLAGYACYLAIRDKDRLLPSYALGGALAFAIVYALGSPWIDGKGMAIVSPALLAAGLTGAALLVLRTSHNIEGWLVGAVTAGLILMTSFLFYQGVFLAPYDEQRELERIGEDFDGEGPALLTEGSTYGPRHFLRELDAENAKDLRRRTVALADGGLPDDVPYLDTDLIATPSLAPYNLLVLRRSPAASRPPGDFGLAEAGTYYEVWERGGEGAAPGSPLERLPLGEPPLNSSAVPDCAQVESLAAAAGADGTLLAARPADSVPIDLSGVSLPGSWERDGSTRVIPHSSGSIEVGAELPAEADYTLWVGGNILGELEVSAGDQTAEPRRQALNQNLYEPFGPFELAAGEQTFTLDYSDSRFGPGAGGDPTPLGPIFVQRVQPADRGTVSVPASDYRQLCDQAWDWIEAYG